MSGKSARPTSAVRSSTAAGSPAKMSAVLEAVAASMASALGSGASTPVSSTREGRSGSSSRTSLPSSATGSPLCSGTLPRSGMMLGGTVSPLLPSAPLTSATGSSSSRAWPTPTATYWASSDAAAVLARWAGKKTPKGNCQPTVGEVVQALHGGRVNLDWLDCLLCSDSATARSVTLLYLKWHM